MLPHAKSWRSRRDGEELPSPTDIVPFAGRISANQEFSVDKNNCTHIELLQNFPVAAPWIPFRDSLSLRHFLQPELWKAAVVEAIGQWALISMDATRIFIASGTCLLVYLTCFIAVGLGQMVK